MLIKRNKNVISIEIEQSDCLPGLTTEMQADLVEKGMQAQMEVAFKTVEQVLMSPEVVAAGEKVIADWKERWELP